MVMEWIFAGLLGEHEIITVVVVVYLFLLSSHTQSVNGLGWMQFVQSAASEGIYCVVYVTQI